MSFLPGELRRYELEKALLATSSDALGTSSFLFLVVWPGATSSFLLLVAKPFVTSSFLFLVVRPGATSCFLLLVAMPFFSSSFLFLVVRTGATSSFLFLVVRPEATSSFLLLVVTLGATSSFLILVGVPGAATVHGRKIQTLLPENSKLVSLPECFGKWTKQIKPWQHKFNEVMFNIDLWGSGVGDSHLLRGFEYLVHLL